MSLDLFFSMLGNIGVVCFLYAYFMLQKGKLAGNSLTYLLLNLSGATLLMVSLLWDWNLPAFLLELCWALISIYGLLKRRTSAPPI